MPKYRRLHLTNTSFHSSNINLYPKCFLGLYPQFSSTEDFDVYIARDGPVRICTICGLFKNKTITNVRCHIESKHFPGIFNYTCQICAKVCNSKTAFRDHSQSCKKQQMSQLSLQHPQLVDRLNDQRDPLN